MLTVFVLLLLLYYYLLMCVLRVLCVFFPFILDMNFVGRTSRGHTGGKSHRIFHPHSFCDACLNFSREGFSHSFPLSTVKSSFVYERFDRSLLVGIFIYLFISDKNPVYRDRTHVPTCQKVTRLPPLLSYRGDLSVCVFFLCAVVPFILDVRFVDAPTGVIHRRKVTQNFSTFLLRCLP